MVHAAATGAFNYAKADPYDKKWRLRHVLIIRNVIKTADAALLQEMHEHWLAYVGHSNLAVESWENVKQRAADLLNAIKTTTHPWLAEEKKETADVEDTIYAKYGDLINSYKAMIAEQRDGEKKAEEWAKKS